MRQSKRTLDVRSKRQSKPWFDPNADAAPEPKKSVSESLSGYQDFNLTWKDLDFIRVSANTRSAWVRTNRARSKSNTKLPIIVKGVQSVEDVQLCVEHGAQGVILVSTSPSSSKATLTRGSRITEAGKPTTPPRPSMSSTSSACSDLTCSTRSKSSSTAASAPALMSSRPSLSVPKRSVSDGRSCMRMARTVRKAPQGCSRVSPVHAEPTSRQGADLFASSLAGGDHKHDAEYRRQQDRGPEARDGWAGRAVDWQESTAVCEVDRSQV